MKKDNIIDLGTYRTAKKITKAVDPLFTSSEVEGKVLDFQDHRSEKSSEERRRVTRTVLSQFVGVFVVVRDGILQPVQVHDISISGLAFDLPKEVGAFNLDESVTLRIYMSHDTYFSFSAKIANVREISELGLFRHGGSFKKSVHTKEEALYHFVRFLETVSSSAKKDKGERVSGQVDL